MKAKALVFFLALGAVAVGGSIYFYLQLSAPVPGKGSLEVGGAVATTMKKNLSVTPMGSTAAHDIPASAPVSPGDTLATSHDGRGLVTMSNGSTAVLDYDSSVQIEGLDPVGTHTSLSLVAGSVWARVEKVIGQGEYFQIKTRNVVAVVHGTSFGLSYRKDGSTQLLVSKGIVALTPLDPKTGRKEDEKMILVTAGNKGVVSADGSTTQSSLDSADTSTEWFTTNNATNQNPSSSVSTSTDTKPSTNTSPTVPTTNTTKPTTFSNSASAGSGSSATAGGSVVTADACGSFSETGAGSGSSLKLSAISPASVSQGKDTTITLTGSGFECVTEIDIGGKALIQSDTGEIDFQIVNNSSITLSSTVLPVGSFDVVLQDSLGNKITLPKAITVTL